jgi:predicted nucleic acid-binding protein
MRMATTLVDTNVLIDVLANDPDWRPWSVAMLDQQAGVASLIITDITYSELAPQFATSRFLDGVIATLGVVLQRIPTEALFVAGRTFQRYRSRGGLRSNIPADFFIGAHAQVLGCPILTRDVRRYRTYFPDVVLITPEPR